MRNLEERGIDYPRSPSQVNDESALSETVTLRHPEEYSPVINPPAAAGTYVEDNRFNYSPTISFDNHTQSLFQDPEIRDAMKSGWILPLHQFLKLGVSDGRVEEQRRHLDPLIQHSSMWKSPETGSVHTIVTVRTLWVPEVSEGTSLLITQPHFSDPDEYTVLTTLIDADTIPMYIDIPVMVHGTNLLTVHNNTPIAQVIPVPRSLLRAKSRIVEPVSE